MNTQAVSETGSGDAPGETKQAGERASERDKIKDWTVRMGDEQGLLPQGDPSIVPVIHIDKDDWEAFRNANGFAED